MFALTKFAAEKMRVEYITAAEPDFKKTGNGVPISMSRPTPSSIAKARKSPGRIAGRPREFDADVALRAAMNLFWEKGYRDTSINDLCSVTGVLSGSLYAAFGDKRKLFLAALDQYIDGELARMNQSMLSKKITYASLHAALHYYTRITSVAFGQRGCLATNSALELIPGDPELADRIERMFRRIATTLEAAIEKGQDSDIFTREVDADALANHLLCVIEGLHVLKRVFKDEEELRAMVTIAMRTLTP